MSNSDFYDIVNVGSSRLATDGECIRDAFVKINNNYTQIFNTILDYDAGAEFGGWKLIVGVDNSIVISNSINISNNVNVNIANMIANTNNIDLDFNVENSLNLNIENNFNLSVENNLDVSINNGGVTLVTDTNNNIVVNSSSVTFNSEVYAESFISNSTTNLISLSGDIDITTTTGDININASTNSVNFTGDIVMNNNMFNIDASTGDINIQNGAITIDNSGDVIFNNAITIDASQNVNINNALTIDASNNIDIGINNTINIDNSQNITFAPSTNIDFTNTIVNNIAIDIMDIVEFDVTPSLIENGQLLVWDNTCGDGECGAFVAGNLSLSDLTDVLSDPGVGSDGSILIYNEDISTYTNAKPWEQGFAMTDRDIIPDTGSTYNIGSNNTQYASIHAVRFVGDITGSVFADDSTLMVDGVDGKIVGDYENGTSVINNTSVTSYDLVALQDANINDLYVSNKIYGGATGSIKNVQIASTAPSDSTGADGDRAGMVAFDATSIYYCIADWANPGTADIWVKQDWGTTGSW